MSMTDHGRPEYPTGASSERLHEDWDDDRPRCGWCDTRVNEHEAKPGPQGMVFCSDYCSGEWGVSNMEAR